MVHGESSDGLAVAEGEGGNLVFIHQARAHILRSCKLAAGIAQIETHQGIALLNGLTFLHKHRLHNPGYGGIDAFGAAAWHKLALHGNGFGQRSCDRPKPHRTHCAHGSYHEHG